ncbi:MAG: cohesin domain-containing protein [Candidatus Hydrogenedens sp.]
MRKLDSYRSIRIIVMAFISGYFSYFSSAYPAELSIESGYADSGTQIVLNAMLTVSSSESVSAIQFDILYNPDICELITVIAGASSNSAQKQVQYNIVTPGQARVIIAGLNQNIIPSGSIAQITLQVCASTPAGIYDVSLSRAILSSPIGTSVPVSLINGNLTVQRSVFHSADSNRDWIISLTEVLRVIQFYNSKEYYCSCDTEDGYSVTSKNQTCSPHNSDYYGSPDWKIQLYEILRLIQIFNYGSYHPEVGTEDGFALGPT